MTVRRDAARRKTNALTLLALTLLALTLVCPDFGLPTSNSRSKDDIL
jgi:hypothetical protein